MKRLPAIVTATSPVRRLGSSDVHRGSIDSESRLNDPALLNSLAKVDRSVIASYKVDKCPQLGFKRREAIGKTAIKPTFGAIHSNMAETGVIANCCG